MSNEHKLMTLHRRTNRDLVLLVQRQLDRGITLASVATSRNSAFYAEAEKTYVEVERLVMRALPPQPERKWIEHKLKELRSLLDETFRVEETPGVELASVR